jgi:hypothetical protein
MCPKRLIMVLSTSMLWIAGACSGEVGDASGWRRSTGGPGQAQIDLGDRTGHVSRDATSIDASLTDRSSHVLAALHFSTERPTLYQLRFGPDVSAAAAEEVVLAKNAANPMSVTLESIAKTLEGLWKARSELAAAGPPSSIPYDDTSCCQNDPITGECTAWCVCPAGQSTAVIHNAYGTWQWDSNAWCMVYLQCDQTCIQTTTQRADCSQSITQYCFDPTCQTVGGCS